MPETMNVRIGERNYQVEVSGERVFVNGVPVNVGGVHLDAQGGLSFRAGANIMKAVLDIGPRESFVSFNGHEFTLSTETERDRLLRKMAGVSTEQHHHAEIRASMPGMVVRINVQPGTSVEKGHAVLILEAMKMENEIRSPADSIVREIHVKPGQTVEKGDLLMVLD
jgi:pyruvate carboxylase subunit B